jgi:predicted kinase
MKELILVRGVSGSGKSTFAHLIAYACEARVYTTDDYFTDAEGNYNWRAEDSKRAHTWNQDRVKYAMGCQEVGIIIVPNTFTQNWEMKPYLEMANEYGYRVTVVRVESGLTPKELCDRNIHSVPYEAILRQWDRMEDFKK